jgi:O-antigen ligase
MRIRPPQTNTQARPGALFNRRAIRSSAVAIAGEAAPSAGAAAASDRGKHKAAFAGVFLFTLLLYVRPNDLFPFLGTFPLAKIVAIGVLVIYVASKAGAGERLTHWTLELKMLLVIAALGVLLMPVSAAPMDGYNILTDQYIKTVLIFALMINLIDTRERVCALWKLVVACGAWLGIGAIRSYIRGEFTMKGLRIEGMVGGIFGNPNDLATALNVLLAFAILLTLVSKGGARLFYLACSVTMTVGILLTFSRGGFLGLLAQCLVLLWKLGRGQRLKTLGIAALVCVIFLGATPGGYGSRLSSIFNFEEDKTGSASERRELMELAAALAMRHPIVGVGMGNFHIYSIHEKEAHNAYLEIAAELGAPGLLAYLIVIFAPLLSIYRVERQTRRMRTKSEKEMYWMSASLQAAFVAYMVCSFFGSIQYVWYLYYTAAYAIALRQIHAAEESEGSLPDSQALTVKQTTPRKLARGTLWPSYRLRQGNG